MKKQKTSIFFKVIKKIHRLYFIVSIMILFLASLYFLKNENFKFYFLLNGGVISISFIYFFKLKISKKINKHLAYLNNEKNNLVNVIKDNQEVLDRLNDEKQQQSVRDGLDFEKNLKNVIKLIDDLNFLEDNVLNEINNSNNNLKKNFYANEIIDIEIQKTTIVENFWKNENRNEKWISTIDADIKIWKPFVFRLKMQLRSLNRKIADHL